MLAMSNARSVPSSSLRPPPPARRRAPRPTRRGHRPKREPRQLLFTLQWCVKVTGWERKTLLRYLRRHDAIQKYGGRWFVSRKGLRRAFRELYEEVIAEAAESAHDAAENE